MFQLGKTIVSEDILSKDFVCNFSLKGACCVNGDGAPLSLEETTILEGNISKGEAIPAQAGCCY
jgi:hypothetical protein